MATKLSPLDDISTYRKVADKAYNSGINPKAVNAQREKDAGTAEAPPPAPPPLTVGPKFTKGFSPEERAAQAKALAAKLKARDTKVEASEEEE